jgi:hypothetical protein
MTFIDQGFLHPPLVEGVRRIKRSDAERRKYARRGGLTPRTKLEDILRTVFGSLAPGPLNPEKANELGSPPKEALTHQENEDKWLAETTALLGGAPGEALVKARKSKTLLAQLQDLLLEQTGQKKLSKKQHIALRYATWKVMNGVEPDAYETVKKNLKNASPAALDDFQNWVEKQLGWPLLEKLSEFTNKKKLHAETQKWMKSGTG